MSQVGNNMQIFMNNKMQTINIKFERGELVKIAIEKAKSELEKYCENVLERDY